MWPLILAGVRTYSPYIVFPVALVVGTVGYFTEGHFSDRRRGKIQAPSTLDARQDRKLMEKSSSDVDDLKVQIPLSVLDRNLKNPDIYKS